MAIARRLNKGDSGGGGIGNIIGTILGGAVGTLVGGPGAGTLAGASLGGSLGGAAGGQIKKPQAANTEPGAMQRRFGADQMVAQQPPQESVSPILEESIKALQEIPEEFRAKYEEPLISAYAASFKRDRQRGSV
jgi:hypothetical protein